MRKRDFITGIIAITLSSKALSAQESFKIMKSEQEWKKILTPAQFAILRKERTEKPFSNSLMGESSNLLYEKRDGIYCCAGCKNELYLSSTKYESGTGWPSFYEAISDSVSYRTDWKLFFPRTEVHCADCGGHLGHVFDDGPNPTGKRHCINALSLLFKST